MRIRRGLWIIKKNKKRGSSNKIPKNVTTFLCNVTMIFAETKRPFRHFTAILYAALILPECIKTWLKYSFVIGRSIIKIPKKSFSNWIDIWIPNGSKKEASERTSKIEVKNPLCVSNINVRMQMDHVNEIKYSMIEFRRARVSTWILVLSVRLSI